MEDPAERFRNPTEHFRTYREVKATLRRTIRDLPYGRKTEQFLRGVYSVLTTPIHFPSFNESRKKRELERLVEEARKRILSSEEPTSD